MNGRKPSVARVFLSLAVALLAGVWFAAAAGAAPLDAMDLERWKKLRETERYQLNIAEKYYRESNWKVALSEYEKFLTLYEMSEGASYAQLKWSICKVNLRFQNDAIKEGFQSVIDYWPESVDAVSAAYFIGRTYKDMGEVKKAKKAYQELIEQYPKHIVAGYAMNDLIDITTIEQDLDTRVALWKHLTYEFPRDTNEGAGLSNTAARSLATHCFWIVAFDDAVKAILRVYAPAEVPYRITELGSGAMQGLTADEKTKEAGYKLADLAIAHVHQLMPTDFTKEDQKNLARQYWFYTADIQGYARRYEEVKKVYDRMLEKFGAEDGILQRLGDWFKGQARWDEARATYARFQNKIEGQNQVALSYRQENKIELALETYRRLSVTDVDNAVRWVSEIGAMYWEKQRYLDCVPIYEELIGIDKPNENKWRQSVAWAYQHAGKYPEAIANWRQTDAFPTAYQQMAACHRALNQPAEAVLLYNQIIGASPPHAPWASLEIAYTFHQVGQKERAIKAFQAVCKKYPKDDHAARAHAFLQTEYKLTITLGGDVKEN